MKKILSLALFFSSLLFLTGCSRNKVEQEEKIAIQDITTQEDTGIIQTFTGWILSGNYIVEQVSGSATTTYSGDLFTTVKIINKTTKKRTYFTSYPGQWSDFEIAREANMFSGQTAPTITNTLKEQSFDTLTGNNMIWYNVQVPIDRTLLVHQDTNMVYILDFDDPSGTRNKMSYDDIKILIQHITFTQ